MSERLIAAFQDTQRRIWENELLCQLTSQTMMCTQVFPEKYETTRVVGNYPTGISVTEETSLQVARQLAGKYSKVAVLNFANAVNPGGGVLYGASAQEEDLCRCSNLYSCLVKPEVYEEFYGYNNAFSPYYSDRVIYSPNITVFKTEDLNYTDEWFQIDVITCPAPNLNGVTVADYQKLEKIYCSRIKNILAVAEAHGVQALVLGAFGCGAFKNPPELMAKAFYGELTLGEYKNTFREIVFAIKAESPQGVYNLKVFQSILSPWQQNPLYGKRVSILGDSISTYWENNVEGYPIFYTSKQCIRSGIYAIEDMWWMRVIREFDAELLVNNSSAGSCVAGNTTLSGNNDNRVYQLHKNANKPDAILVAMGMCDYEQGIPVDPEEDEVITSRNYHKYFRSSYQMMLWNLKQIYPAAEIYCSTINYGVFDGKTNHLFANGIHGIPLKKYNDVIRDCAAEYGCRIVDLANVIHSYESIEGIHPTAAGMCRLAEGWIQEISNQENAYYFQEKKKGIDWKIPLLVGVLVILIVIEIILLFFFFR